MARAAGRPSGDAGGPDAAHQCDGEMALGVIGRHQAQCSFEVDRRAPPPLRGPLLREIIPGLCTGSRRCPTGRDEAVVGRSDADLAAFLARVFAASG